MCGETGLDVAAGQERATTATNTLLSHSSVIDHCLVLQYSPAVQLALCNFYSYPVFELKL